MTKRVGVFALLLGVGLAVFQPTAAFAQDRSDRYRGDRYVAHYRNNDHDWRAHEWRERENRDWRIQEWREHERWENRRPYPPGYAYYGGAPNFAFRYYGR